MQGSKGSPPQSARVAATHYPTLQHTATQFVLCNYRILGRSSAPKSMHRRVAATHHTHYNTLQHTAAHCSSLKHTATHCNTMQPWKNSGQSKSTNIMTLGHRVFVFFVIWIWPESLHVAVCFNVLQCVAVCCSVFCQMCCSALQSVKQTTRQNVWRQIS